MSDIQGLRAQIFDNYDALTSKQTEPPKIVISYNEDEIRGTYKAALFKHSQEGLRDQFQGYGADVSSALKALLKCMAEFEHALPKSKLTHRDFQ